MFTTPVVYLAMDRFTKKKRRADDRAAVAATSAVS
jgi:hypothetical protein